MNKRRVLIAFFGLFAVGFFGGRVYADNGKLIINNQVIYEKHQEKEDSIEYLIAPDLFLKGKTDTNQQKLAEREQIAQQAKEKVFVTRQLPETGRDKKAYEKILFLQDYQDNVVHSNPTNKTNHSIPQVLIYFMAGILIVGMLILGILLGRRFSTIFVRKS